MSAPKVPRETRERAIYLAADGLVKNCEADLAVAIMLCADAELPLFIGAWSPDGDTALIEALLEKALAAIRGRKKPMTIARPPS